MFKNTFNCFDLGMNETAKGILGNFVNVVQRYGFIPNGGRIYYLKRSQPPMLISMFYEYLEATGDFQFVHENLETLERVSIRFYLI